MREKERKRELIICMTYFKANLITISDRL